MPRVHYRKANKEHNASDGSIIEKGEMYYTWRIKHTYGGTTYKQKRQPRRSQLTASNFLSQLYDLEDQIGEHTDPDNLNSLVENIRALGEECGESLENMPEGLQQGDTGMLLEERRDAMESWADELDTLSDTLRETLDEISNCSHEL